MKTVAVVAWREIIEHRMFLAAALAALAVTIVVPLIPAFLGWSSADVREVLMWGMALGFTWLSAVFLGASMVTGTVAAGRFGFFLARPVGSAAIWFGKLLGVLVVLLTCQVLVIAPAALIPGVTDLFDKRPGSWWGVSDVLAVGTVVAVPVLLVLVAHSLATVWRGGTAWVVVDVVAFAVAVALGWASIGPLLRVGAEDAATVVGLLLVGGLAVSAVVGGVVQIAAGRGDGRRQHRAFSSIVWPLLLSVVIGTAGYSAWLLHPQAEDLIGVEHLTVQPDGEWIAVSGPTRGWWGVAGSFALDLESGMSFRLALGPAWASGAVAAFSVDGRVAAWSVRDGDEWRIRYGDLDALSDGAHDSRIVLESRPWLVLSPSGDRLATIEEGTLAVTALASGDLVGSARLPTNRGVMGPFFDDENRVRVLVQEPGPSSSEPPHGIRGPQSVLRSLEFDLTSRKLTETGTLAHAARVVAATLDETRDRLLLWTEVDRERSFLYVSARTLEIVDWSADQELGAVARMLADGRLIRLATDADESWLERLTPNGEVDARVRLPGSPKRVVIGSEPTASTVAIAACDREQWDVWWEDFRLLLVDLETRQVREIGRGLPIFLVDWNGVTSPLPAGSRAARLFRGERHSLSMWDPVTDRMEPVIRDRG